MSTSSLSRNFSEPEFGSKNARRQGRLSQEYPPERDVCGRQMPILAETEMVRTVWSCWVVLKTKVRIIRAIRLWALHIRRNIAGMKRHAPFCCFPWGDSTS